ncbi:MAG TPA: OsmC family protein [Acidobacteriaceae bacterium]|nr:OsmC family protein [Acidobacteriaceae bacterium]
MQASATWKQEMIFDAVSHSGHTIVFDGDDAHTQGISPVEAVLMGLCGCTAMDVVSILKKKREPFTGLTVTAVGDRSAHSPRVFTHIKLIYRVSGNVSHKAVEDAVRLSETKYCGVSAMLAKTAKIEFVIEYSS